VKVSVYDVIANANNFKQCASLAKLYSFLKEFFLKTFERRKYTTTYSAKQHSPARPETGQAGEGM
jgi:hypothetical protein